jgi:hypothetical protein
MAVLFGHLGVVLPAALPVLVVSSPPFLRTVAAHLTVLDIGGKAAPMIIAAPPPLACPIGAHDLPGPEL